MLRRLMLLALLAPVVEWFDDGLATEDLKDASALLKALD